jgi:hypothetical protein
MCVLKLFGDFAIVVVFENLDLRKRKAICLSSRRQDFKAFSTERGNAEQAIGAMFPVADRRGRADRIDIGIAAIMSR